jgi:predicted GTPase
VLKVGAVLAGLLLAFFAIKRTGKLEQQLEDQKATSNAETERAQTEVTATLEKITNAKTADEVVNAMPISAVDSELRSKWSD